VKENVGATVIGLDEAKPLIVVEHLNFACWHWVPQVSLSVNLEPAWSVHKHGAVALARGFRAPGARAIGCALAYGGGCIVAFEDLRDESLLRFYNNIRSQFEADRGSKHKFTTGPSVQQHASALREEMIKRRLQHIPIEWDRD
jgi:hypothetical protein